MSTPERGIEEYKMPSIEVDGHSWIRLIDHITLVDQQLQKAREETDFDEDLFRKSAWYKAESAMIAQKAREEVVTRVMDEMLEYTHLGEQFIDGVRTLIEEREIKLSTNHSELDHDKV